MAEKEIKGLEDIKVLLGEIRDRLPVREIPLQPAKDYAEEYGYPPAPVRKTHAVQPPSPHHLEPRSRPGNNLADKRQSLAILRAVLDDWIRVARENHEALGHRDETPGEECWKNFHVSDFRNMINDAARELGLTEFPKPAKPEEDKR